MSILDNPSHEVVVVLQEKVKNQYGGWDLTDGVGIIVRCNVQPTTAEERQALGGTVADTWVRAIGRGPWPGGVHSKVQWAGREWDQHGEPRVYTQSKRTAHFDVILKARGSEVV